MEATNVPFGTLNSSSLVLRLRRKLSFLNTLGKTQKLSLGILSFLVLILPVVTILVLTPTRFSPKAYLPITPPITSPVTPPPQPTPTPTPTTTSSPTPTPVNTPTPIPTPIHTPIPTPRPTVLPTPSPTPVPFNNIPIIETASLPAGKWLRNYTATVVGYDYDLSDNLTMTISSLPFRLKQSQCKTARFTDRVQITCLISGVPFTIGTSNISITLKDNKGGMVQKILPLKITLR